MRVWLAGPCRKKEDVDPALWRRAAAINRQNYGRDEPEPIVLDPPAYGRLGEIKKPTLVIVGEYDVAETLRAYELIAEGIAGAKRMLMKNTAHLPSMEKPEEFNRLVLDFLEKS